MEASFSTPWFSNQIVQAICWTLIHSLWIGLLTAVVTGVVMIVTQKSTSRLRYQLLSSTLMAFVLLMTVVFYWELTALHSQYPTGSLPLKSVDVSQAAFYQNNIISSGTGLPNRLITFVNLESGWIFAIWLVFFIFKSLRLVGGIYYVHRIRYRKVFAIDQIWQTKLDSYRQSLGISQSVGLLQSALVQVPVTVGLFKPVILVPVGLFFQLSPQQIETILWHELAHIWRRDYLVNILQCVVETIFFFNPGLLWLSSLIRDEREACCDDIVLARSSGKSHYVEALLAFQLNTHTDSALVMGLGSHKLVNRLKRMVTEENKRLSLIEKIALLVGLLIFSAFTMLPPSKKEGAPRREISPAKTVQSMESPLLPTRNKVEEPVVQLASRRIKTLPDTLPVSPTQPAPLSRQFTSILFANNNHDMANRDMTVLDDTGTRYHLKVINNQLVALEINDTPVAASDLNQHELLLRQIDQAWMEKNRAKREGIAANMATSEAVQKQQRQRQKEAQQRKLDNRQSGIQPEKLAKKGANKPAPHQTSEMTKSEPASPALKKKWGAVSKADTVAKMRAWQTKKMPAMPDNSYDQQRVRGVLAALVQQNIVANPSAVDGFGLSESELVVNGVRLSAELHQQLKTQYGIQPDYGLFYGSGSSGKGIILEKSDL